MWLILLLLCVTLIYYFIQRVYTHWEREGIPYDKPVIPFGTLDPIRRQERSLGLIMSDVHMRFKEKIVGIYLFFRPAILVRDAELARKILITDFSSFHDRGIYVDEKRDEINASLFNMRGQQWRTLRNKLTPSFTSGKLKGMFETIDEVGDKLVKHLNGSLAEKPEGEIFEMKDLLTTFAIDIIASVIFGLDVDSFANPNNEFRMVSKKIFESRSIVTAINSVSSFICPPICGLIVRLGHKDKNLLLLRDVVKRNVEFREQTKVVRKDMFQLLLRLRNSGKIGDDDDTNWDIETAAENLKSMSIDMLTAQTFLFYIAGSETTAATSAFTLYELSMYPELLKRAQDEVQQILHKYNHKPNEKYSYEAIQDFKFLEWCVMETIRKYPGLPFLNRECTQDYDVPDTPYKIKKGTPIIISLHGMHRDPAYFPNPEKYDPDRFDPEIMNYNPTAFLPFGEGPRHCIALRMGKVNSKLAIAKILANFDIAPNPHKEIEFIFDSAPILIARDGLKLRLSKKKL